MRWRNRVPLAVGEGDRDGSRSPSADRVTFPGSPASTQEEARSQGGAEHGWPEPGATVHRRGIAGDTANEDAAAERALVAQAKGDRRAFALLYDRYLGPVYGYCFARLGNREAAEDATSLVFAKALAALPSCRDDSFRSWLFSIAHNVTTDSVRRARPSEPLPTAESLIDASPSPEDLALAAEGARSVRAVLAQLPADQRRVLELRLAGLSGPEIAEVLERSHPAIKMLQLCATKRLRALLGTESDDPEGDHHANP